MKTEEEIKRLLKKGEKQTIEAKLAQGGLPRTVWETYSSFANTQGGIILLGVEEVRGNMLVPRGVTGGETLIKNLWNGLNNPDCVSRNILLEKDVYLADCNGKKLVVIEVPQADRHDKPVYLGKDVYGKTFRRNGDGDYKASRESINAMIRDSGDKTSDESVFENTAISDVESETLKNYRAAFRSLRPQHSWNILTNEEFLLKIGAARLSSGGKLCLTGAGLLCFGSFVRITDEFPNFFLDYREHLGNPDVRWTNRIYSGDPDWSGNLIDFYFQVSPRIATGVQTPFSLDSKMRRVSDTPLKRGLREAFANSLIHADYYGRRGVVIDKSMGKITFRNPGTFRIPIEDAVNGGISDARNGRVFNIFSLINVGERAGSGLCDIFEVCKSEKTSLPKLSQEFEPDTVCVTIDGFEMEEEYLSDLKTDPNLTVSDLKVDLDDLNLDLNDPNPVVNDLDSDPNDLKTDPNPTDNDLSLDLNDPNPVVNDLDSDPNDLKIDPNPTVSDLKVDLDDLNDTDLERELLSIMKDFPEENYKFYASKANVSEATIKRMIQSLKATGKIMRLGSRRAGSWRLIDK